MKKLFEDFAHGFLTDLEFIYKAGETLQLVPCLPKGTEVELAEKIFTAFYANENTSITKEQFIDILESHAKQHNYQNMMEYTFG